MKITTLRAAAFFFDTLLFAFCLGGIFFAFDINGKTFYGTLIMIVLFIPFFFKDCIFKNASIGKKIFGIRIYSKTWQPLSPFSIFKRNVVMLTIGYLMYFKSKALNPTSGMLDLIDWERKRLGTVVIEKDIFQKLSQEAIEKKGDYAENMTRLYGEFLRDSYSK